MLMGINGNRCRVGQDKKHIAMKLKSMLLIAAMALVGGAANAQNTVENDEPRFWVKVREDLCKDDHYVYAGDVLEECKAMVKERNAKLKESPEMLSKNRFLTGMEINGCPEYMVHTIKLDINIDVHKLLYAQLMTMYSQERADLIERIKADTIGEYGNCMRRWISAGYKVFYRYTNKKGDAIPILLEIQTQDVVGDLQEDVSLKLKEDKFFSVGAELPCNDTVSGKAKDLVYKMNYEFAQLQESFGFKGESPVHMRLDYASKSLVFVSKISYADTASLQEKRAKLNFDGVENEFVNMVCGLHMDGKAVLADLIKAGYSVKMQFCEDGGILLYEATVTGEPQHDAVAAVADSSVVDAVGAACSCFLMSEKVVADTSGKEDDVIADNDGLFFALVESQASFPGGDKAMMNYLYKNLKYPKDALDNGKQGRVVVQIVVGTDGYISDVKVLESVYPSLDAEAVRVVKAMPRWIPERLEGGKLVRVRTNLPITFRLS